MKTAGYRCKAQGAAKVQAARMLTRANLSAEIAKRRAELCRVSNVSARAVIAVLTAQMRSDVTEFLGEDGSFNLQRIRSAWLGRLIKKLVLKRVVPTKRVTARNNVQSLSQRTSLTSHCRAPLTRGTQHESCARQPACGKSKPKASTMRTPCANNGSSDAEWTGL